MKKRVMKGFLLRQLKDKFQVNEHFVLYLIIFPTYTPSIFYLGDYYLDSQSWNKNLI